MKEFVRLAGVLPALEKLPSNDCIQVGEHVGRNVTPGLVRRPGEDPYTVRTVDPVVLRACRS
jgi:hypothetical protein